MKSGTIEADHVRLDIQHLDFLYLLLLHIPFPSDLAHSGLLEPPSQSAPAERSLVLVSAHHLERRSHHQDSMLFPRLAREQQPLLLLYESNLTSLMLLSIISVKTGRDTNTSDSQTLSRESYFKNRATTWIKPTVKPAVPNMKAIIHRINRDSSLPMSRTNSALTSAKSALLANRSLA